MPNPNNVDSLVTTPTIERDRWVIPINRLLETHIADNYSDFSVLDSNTEFRMQGANDVFAIFRTRYQQYCINIALFYARIDQHTLDEIKEEARNNKHNDDFTEINSSFKVLNIIDV